MGMTMAEKILASHSGRTSVSPGEYVTAETDVMMGNDITFPAACRNLTDIGLTRFADADKVVVCIDHRIPAMTAADAESHKVIRDYVASSGSSISMMPASVSSTPCCRKKATRFRGN